MADYTASESLQTAKVSWNYRTSHDVVNLDVWDVVDAPKLRKAAASGLKLDSGSDGPSDTGARGNRSGFYADADMDIDSVPVAGKQGSRKGSSTVSQVDTSVLDVYRGTHAVVLLFNPLKKWTWEYVQKELSQIPPRIQTLVMANFKDVVVNPSGASGNTSGSVPGGFSNGAGNSCIDPEDVRLYIDMLKRPEIYFLEASMQNCYGLKGLKTFLNLPFLLLQKQVLETQLAQNNTELLNAKEEYQLTTESDSYDAYLQMISNRANSKPPPAAPTTAATNPPANQPTSPKTSAPTSPVSSPKVQPQSNPTTQKPTPQQTPATNTSAPKETPRSPEPESGGFMAKLFGRKDDKEIKATSADKKTIEELTKLKEQGAAQNQTGVGSVDDFVPDADNSWLDDNEPVSVPKVAQVAKPTPKATAPQKPQIESDSDDDAPNPALASYVDELDESDQLMMEALAKARALKEEEAKKAKAKAKPVVAAPVVAAADSDDEDDDRNPALAAYEDDLDFEDQKIKGKPAPVVAKPTAAPQTPAQAGAKKVGFADDDSDDEMPNPHLSGYSEDLDVEDVISSATSTPHAPRSASPSAITPVVTHKPNAPATTVSAKVSTAPQTSVPTAKLATAAKPTAKATRPIDSDSDDDNHLVAKDESDSDDDYAGYVPKKTAASKSASLSDMAAIPDFNPMDATSEADADAFWASQRPTHRTSSAAMSPSSSQSKLNGAAVAQTAHPFAFGSASPQTISPSTSSAQLSSSGSKDKKDKHKHKHHKDKSKKDMGSSASSLPAYSQPVSYASPPATTTPPPAAASKKNNPFYL